MTWIRYRSKDEPDFSKYTEEQFTEVLVREFPEFFVDLGGDMTKTCMHWGIEFGSGWYNNLYDCCVMLKSYINNHKNPESVNGFKWSQLKEKFGEARFYTEGGDNIMDLIVSDFESKCSHTCEKCGSVDSVSLRGKGWYYTSCAKCAKPEDLKEDEKGI